MEFYKMCMRIFHNGLDGILHWRFRAGPGQPIISRRFTVLSSIVNAGSLPTPPHLSFSSRLRNRRRF